MATIKSKVSLLRELLVLKEVIDTGQIFAAAERNGIKHSNMSKMLTELETRFAAKLLVRSPAGCVPTNMARQIYSDVERISEILDSILDNLSGPEELIGYVSIWTEEGFAGSGLLPELSKLYSLHPKVRLDILTNRHANMSNPDITILDIRSLQKIPGKTLFKFKTRAKFYTSPEYINKFGIPKDMDDMLENFDICIRQKFLSLPECSFLLKRAKRLNTTTDSASIVYQLASDGAGIALMPEWCTNKNQKLIEVPNIDFSYEYQLTGIVNPMKIKSPKVHAFLEFFYEFCREHEIELEMFE
ncbi:MAG: LysR family transcriptional regulator [Alphaproteobacteria bacterium]|nr:LysR family transcriptional regulator [Alphaproteobacteria bacterium]